MHRVTALTIRHLWRYRADPLVRTQLALAIAAARAQQARERSVRAAA